MADLFGIGTMTSGLYNGTVNLGLGIGNIVSQSYTDEQNREMQLKINRENAALARELNEKNRQYELEDQAYLAQREDTALRRKAAELEALGINPIMAGLAGGQGAQSQMVGARNTSNMIAAEAPQMSNAFAAGAEYLGNTNPLDKMLDSQRKIAEIENINADTDAKKSGKKGTDLDNTRKEVENEYIRDKIKNEIQGMELNNKNMQQVTKNLMAEYGYRMNQEQREKAWHDIEKLNAKTERTLKAAQTANYMSNTGLTDQEKTIRKKEFELKKKQIEQGYYATLAEIIGNSAGNALRGKK